MLKVSRWLHAHPVIWKVLLPGIIIRRFFVKIAQKKRRILRDKLFHRIIGGTLLFDLPEFHGKFHIDARSDITQRILFDGTYESEFASMCSKMIDASRDAIDIGANVGLFTVLMAKQINEGKRVLSLEPTPGAYKLLEKNVTQNEVLEKVITKQVVATQEEGESQMNVCVGREEYSSCGPIMHDSAVNLNISQIIVPGITLDALCRELNLNPGFIKIDTEGWEHHVLRGATETLTKYKPVILTEISESLLCACGGSSKDVFDWLEAKGYSLFDADYPSQRAIAPFTGEVLALPK